MKALKGIKEAAGLLGISPWTVRSYIRAGRIRPVRLGRRVLIHEDELQRIVAEGQEQGKRQAAPGDVQNVNQEVAK